MGDNRGVTLHMGGGGRVEGGAIDQFAPVGTGDHMDR